jgi:hypothetical protein
MSSHECVCVCEKVLGAESINKKLMSNILSWFDRALMHWQKIAINFPRFIFSTAIMQKLLLLNKDSTVRCDEISRVDKIHLNVLKCVNFLPSRARF